MAYVTIADGDIDPESPITTSLMTNLRDNPIAIAGRLAGAPLMVNVDSVFDQGGSLELKMTVVDIGDWDMVAAASTNVAHGLTLANIRHVTVMIRDDAATIQKPLNGVGAAGAGLGGVGDIGVTNITLLRVTGARFDSTDYNATSYNRGWLYIWYVEP